MSISKSSNRLGICLLVILVLTLLLPGDLLAQTGFDFPDFSSVNNLNLVGVAAQLGNKMRLNPASREVRGGMWYADKQPVANGFETTFVFQITDLGGGGADGISFIIQNYSSTALGGHTGYNGMPNSLGVELDTWDNTEFTDYGPNHISVHSNGTDPNTSGPSSMIGVAQVGPNMSDGNPHTAKIAYSAGTLTVFIDDLSQPVLTVAVDLASLLDLDNGKAWVGIAGGTGASYENHDILGWSFAVGGIPPGGGTELKPVMKNFNTGSEICTSTYTITNDSSYVTVYNHVFYNAEVGGSVIHTFQDTIPPFSWKTYNLADIPVPNGYRGRVVIQADRPSNMVVDPCPENNSDTTPPSITNIQKSPEYVNKQGCASPNTVTIRADVTDASGLASVRLYYQPPGQGWTETPMSLETDTTYKATIGPFNQGGTMPFFIRAQDNFGNPKEATMEYLSIACVTISHVEVIQVTQNITNPVPLIAGKPALVRVYVDCGENCDTASGVTGTLKISTSSKTYSPDNENGSVEASHPTTWTEQQGELDKTLNFLIPGDLLTGTVLLTATVGGNVWNGPFSFEPTKELNVIIVPIRYNGQEPDDVAENMHRDLYTAQFIYPTAKVNDTWTYVMNWDKCLEKKLLCPHNRNRSKLLTKLAQYDNNDTFVYGLLPDVPDIGGKAQGIGTGTSAFGTGSIKKPLQNTGISQDWNTFVHELGHLMGRAHTNTVDNLNHKKYCRTRLGPTDKYRAYVVTDSDWVTEDGVSLTEPPPFKNSSIQQYGIRLDFYQQVPWWRRWAIQNPDVVFDYMSYCGDNGTNSWTSDWTYTKIYTDYFRVSLNSMSSQNLETQSSAHLLVSGLVFTDDTAILDPAWVVTPGSTSGNPPAGTGYCLEVQSSGGTPLVSHCFDLSFFDFEEMEPINVDGFNIILPYPAGVTRIVLKKGLRNSPFKP